MKKLIISSSLFAGALIGMFGTNPAVADEVVKPRTTPTVVSVPIFSESRGEWNLEPITVESKMPELATKESKTHLTKNKEASYSSIVSTAKSFIGVPYVWGGTTPSGWDCIGFVRYVFAQHGIKIGALTTSVLSVGEEVPYSQAQAGDILYWKGHVAISLGNGKQIGAWNPEMGTMIGNDSWNRAPEKVIRVNLPNS